ncbi:MAG: aspartate aminotransferase family protein [Rhodospirillales bacterium]|nr:MAG: aspartate aminotransferase family protein [Rhodospirillales bacterium]
MASAVMQNYRRLDLAFQRGEGPWLFAEDGRRYLDFGAGIAVTGLGHCHPHLVAALTRQAETLWHCSNLYRIPEQERLASRLASASFADAVFFCNSGAEAIECGLKLVRKYQDDAGRPERYRVITFAGAFHGRTLATIAAGGSANALAGFDPVVDGFDQVPFGDLDAVRTAVGERTAAILVEPVQGEGGIRVADPAFLQGLRAVADGAGLILMFDEVQCGIGRTGRLFAHQWSGVVPDVMAVAKGLGGGFPIGACLTAGQAARTLTPGSHGTTFGGNPLAMAVGNAVLDVVLAPGFLDHVRRTGEVLRAQLERLPAHYPGVVAEVRGIGLMLGLKCVVENRRLVAALMDAGLLTVPASDNVVRLLPALIIDQEHADAALERIHQACAVLADKAA